MSDQVPNSRSSSRTSQPPSHRSKSSLTSSSATLSATGGGASPLTINPAVSSGTRKESEEEEYSTDDDHSMEDVMEHSSIVMRSSSDDSIKEELENGLGVDEDMVESYRLERGKNGAFQKTQNCQPKSNKVLPIDDVTESVYFGEEVQRKENNANVANGKKSASPKTDQSPRGDTTISEIRVPKSEKVTSPTSSPKWVTSPSFNPNINKSLTPSSSLSLEASPANSLNTRTSPKVNYSENRASPTSPKSPSPRENTARRSSPQTDQGTHITSKKQISPSSESSQRATDFSNQAYLSNTKPMKYYQESTTWRETTTSDWSTGNKMAAGSDNDDANESVDRGRQTFSPVEFVVRLSPKSLNSPSEVRVETKLDPVRVIGGIQSDVDGSDKSVTGSDRPPRMIDNYSSLVGDVVEGTAASVLPSSIPRDSVIEDPGLRDPRTDGEGRVDQVWNADDDESVEDTYEDTSPRDVSTRIRVTTPYRLTPPTHTLNRSNQFSSAPSRNQLSSYERKHLTYSKTLPDSPPSTETMKNFREPAVHPHLTQLSTVLANKHLHKTLNLLQDKHDNYLHRMALIGKQGTRIKPSNLSYEQDPRGILQEDQWKEEIQTIMDQISHFVVVKDKERQIGNKSARSMVENGEGDGSASEALESKRATAELDEKLFQENVRLWKKLAALYRSYTKQLRTLQSDESRKAFLIRRLKSQMSSLHDQLEELQEAAASQGLHSERRGV